MKQLAGIALAAVLACGTGLAAAEEPRITREQWQQMSPDQKAAAKAKARERWESMTPDERAAAKAKARERYESLPPEQQEAVKQRLAERRAAKQQ